MIPFNKPYLSGKESEYIQLAVDSGMISGNGNYTKKCQKFFEDNYNIKKALLTTSCTDALEMCALLLNIKEGDEVIMPSYTFVSTANAFVLRGAKIVFADSKLDHPNIDETKIEALITPKTKAIVVVHYAGCACEMDAIMQIANKHDVFVIEDAAQAIDSFYKGKALGSIGHLATFSFHETKNIISGEGGLLAINDEQFIERSEIIWEKGTNRSSFFRGEVDKYGWVDVGSSFLPSEIIAAFLWAQLENSKDIQAKRIKLWSQYEQEFKAIGNTLEVDLPQIPKDSSNNAHIFYIICKTNDERTQLINFLKSKGIYAVFHYLSLHKSEYYNGKHDGRTLTMTEEFSNRLLRLPLFYELKSEDVTYIVKQISEFYEH
ncbi:dTDP-4-amino-4,6-dideoxygalactose transaminase [Psychroserpens ponticola]|uniref:dTDP-4-amino-4,6-dideoxygalactose transaminase n=1 Tax=Psychroserpens ponticola TaxID=2932268 RepID=A0ABY7S239_9FLAO|nr:dTDP-4-amino-4,6-dideoxygalactose transaminase [Psychroserpens ponticola]WCO02521.1 dTDP-4-amino-4,6-dideoxygalactose transaminase [Psychroserpens ponticola]